ncbi:MAG: MOSC domain-containing protein [Ignavibacteriales bacterium]|nr:MOSC domain-containing protein [Ignavibacteriales bacterium]MBI3787698.1 MOSC domain-containing protein [Ignavibacteriales bacterium]
MILSEIVIYPIKSAKGISLSSAMLEERGLQYDRRWMLVDRNGLFLTQRKFPRMALMDVQVKLDSLLVNAPGMSELTIPFEVERSKPVAVTVWDDTVQAFTISSEINEWLSRFLEFPCALVYMRKESTRFVESTYATRNDQVSFADSFSLHLLSEESLHDLNSRLETPVPMNRFRANLVIRGCKPYEEDTWRVIEIGSLKFHIVKACPRCTIPTVDQTNAMQGKEPIRTLRQYRTVNGQVLFGQNLIHKSNGILNAGDEVKVIEHTAS